MMALLGVGKIRPGAHLIGVLHEKLGVPFKYFPLLAACEFSGAVGLAIGIWWPPIGIAAGIGLVLYFAGAIVTHLRIGDVKGVGPATLLLFFAATVLTARLLAKP